MHNLTAKHLKNYTEQTLNGDSLLSDYSIKHTKNSIFNEYIITTEVRGLLEANVWLNIVSIECLNNNEETLIDPSVEALFEQIFSLNYTDTKITKFN
tara:strand:+ start:11674 stop:11964 length:291 start_codon:yes stop_codon:yes gene_type:complete